LGEDGPGQGEGGALAAASPGDTAPRKRGPKGKRVGEATLAPSVALGGAGTTPGVPEGGGLGPGPAAAVTGTPSMATLVKKRKPGEGVVLRPVGVEASAGAAGAAPGAASAAADGAGHAQGGNSAGGSAAKRRRAGEGASDWVKPEGMVQGLGGVGGPGATAPWVAGEGGEGAGPAGAGGGAVVVPTTFCLDGALLGMGMLDYDCTEGGAAASATLATALALDDEAGLLALIRQHFVCARCISCYGCQVSTGLPWCVVCGAWCVACWVFDVCLCVSWVAGAGD
jgi:hypothetical protein